MAPIASSRVEFDEIPTVVGIFSAFGLVFTVSLFAWICCQRRSSKSNKTPPYKFVHVLKGVDIYPENLNCKKKFGGDDKNEAKNRPAAPKISLHLDLEKRDLNGNFPKTNLKAGSSSDLESATPKLFTETEKEATSPESLKSSTSLTSEEQEKLGALYLSLEYNFEKKAFVVNIKEARGLPAMDEQSMTSDPYIKMTILPEKKHKVKTRVLRKTLDPVFDETFTFYGIPYPHIQDLSLHFTVLSFDRFSRDDVIGEVLIPLSGIELSDGKMLMDREIIKRNAKKSSGRGELLVSLCYQSTTNTLTVVVLKARHLPKSDVSGLSEVTSNTEAKDKENTVERLLGQSMAVTSVTMQFISHQFPDYHDPTIEDAYKTQVRIDDEPAYLDILDTAGQAEFTAMREQYMRGGEGFIICYSVTDRQSFQEAAKFKELIFQVRHTYEIPLVLVGNKIDLEQFRQVSTDEGLNLAREYNCALFETSAALRFGIDDAFHGLVREIRRKESMLSLMEKKLKRKDSLWKKIKGSLKKRENIT
ncbi:synaptotagmin-4 isoform X1 [Acomys russatus]|nr:synaptotagmin-4 isoform X1 [Acomys russatus]